MRSRLAELAAAGRRTANCTERSSSAPPPSVLGGAVGQSGDVSGQGLEPDPAAYVPSYCDRLGQNTVDRFRSCQLYGFFHSVVEVPSGVLLGQGLVYVIEWAQLNARTRQWNHRVVVVMTQATGVVTSGLGIYVAGRCYAGCAVTGADPPDAWVVLFVNQAWTGKWNMASAGSATLYGYQNLDIYTYHPRGQTIAYGTTDPFPEHRCDSVSYIQVGGTVIPGCVYDLVPGVFVLSASDPAVTKAAIFYRDAYNTLPDRPGRLVPLPSGPPLHRLRDSAGQKANRDVAKAACSTLPPSLDPADDSCDEYPFASTYEGHARVAPGRAAVRWVPLEQNNTAGSRLGSTFYFTNRILDGDPFYVYVY